MWQVGWEKVLQLAALILSVVNGLILVRIHVRDRSRVRVTPVHPDTYQWWFRLPDSSYQGRATRPFGFLAYVGVSNRGYRAVTIDRWRLEIRAANGKRVQLRAISIPEPAYRMGEHMKVFPVLGQKGPMHQGDMRVESGDSTAGMAFYVYECFGDNTWDPSTAQGRIVGQFSLVDVFGGKARCRISFRQKTLEEVEAIIPDLRNIMSTISKDRQVSG